MFLAGFDPFFKSCNNFDKVSNFSNKSTLFKMWLHSVESRKSQLIWLRTTWVHCKLENCLNILDHNVEAAYHHGADVVCVLVPLHGGHLVDDADVYVHVGRGRRRLLALKSWTNHLSQNYKPIIFCHCILLLWDTLGTPITFLTYRSSPLLPELKILVNYCNNKKIKW